MSSLKNDLNEKQYWRSLSDLADTEEFQSYVSKEFADVQVGEEGFGFPSSLHAVDGRILNTRRNPRLLVGR